MTDKNGNYIQLVEMVTEHHRECPFCGNNNILITTEGFYNYLVENSITHSAAISIDCNVCDLTLYEHSVDSGYKLKRETLLNKWNLGIHRRGED